MAIERRLHYFATACQTSNRNPSTSTTKFDRALDACRSSAISCSSIRDQTLHLLAKRERRERERERRMKKEQLSGNWRTRRMAVLICTRSLELKVPSGALINLGVREERRFLERDSEERERERGGGRERKTRATGERVLRRM